MKKKNLGVLVICLSYLLTLSTFFVSPDSEARVGGGRSFGSRGSRGFSAPRYSGGNGNTYRGYNHSSPSQSRPYGGQQYQNNHSNPGNSAPYATRPNPVPPSTGSSFLKTLGAGIAGGFLGNMLFRSLGMGGGAIGGYGLGGGGLGVARSGFGILEFLLLLGLIFLLFKIFARKNLPSTGYSSNSNYGNSNSNVYELNRDEGRDEASQLMRDARPGGWESRNGSYDSASAYSQGPSVNFDEIPPIDRDQAMDLFFQVQGAWTNRDLTSASAMLDTDARRFLEEELTRLKASKQINRLENIAVRDVQPVEAWREMGKEYSTVRITANLLDFTVDETTQQVVSGSKTSPVKFEEFWTFSREPGSSWKLSAIQQI